jgi:hypothetical protein
MSIATSLGISLVLQDQAIRDTVVMIPADRGVLGVLAVTGQFAVSVVALGLAGTLVYMLLQMRKTVAELTALMQSSNEDFSAAAQAIRDVAEDVRGVTQNVKTDYGAVSDTVRYVNTGVRRAVRRTEARIRRLDALVGVAQEEAEEFVMSTASTLRGVRLGAAALKRSFLFTKRRGAKRKKRRPFRDERPARDRSSERPRIRTKVADPQ